MAIFRKDDVRTRLPDGVYKIIGESCAPMTFPENRGKLAGRWGLKVTVRVVEPATYTNYPLYTDLCLSSEEDPTAEQPHTVGSSMHGRLLSEMVDTMGVEIEGVEIAEGIDIDGFNTLLELSTRTYKDKTTGETKTIQENWKAFYMIGSKEVYADDPIDTSPPPTGPKPPVKRTPTKTTKPAKAAKTNSAPQPDDTADDAFPPEKILPTPGAVVNCPQCQIDIAATEFATHFPECISA